jgi:RNA polymerase sigma-70 factor (ECF subfamily)
MDDAKLLSIFRESGDKAVLAEFYQRYAHLMLGIGLKYLRDRDKAGDLVMQVFEKLVNDLNKYTIDNFKSWLFQVMKNECLQLLRSARHRKTTSMETIEGNERLLVENEQADHLINEQEQEGKTGVLMEAIATLKEEQKVCIELFYLQEESYQDISIKTGYDLKKVKSYIQNGKRNLRIELEKKGIDWHDKA